jgi:hypothetical protein
LPHLLREAARQRSALVIQNEEVLVFRRDWTLFRKCAAIGVVAALLCLCFIAAEATAAKKKTPNPSPTGQENGVAHRVAALEANQGLIMERLVAVEEALGAVGGDIGALETAVATLQMQVADLQMRVAALEAPAMAP